MPETPSRLLFHPDWPAAPEASLFHVTHPKAGSQWIRRILTQCVPHRVVSPADAAASQFFTHPLRPCGVYPAIYATRERFLSVQLPQHYHCFVVIRDLRDTLVSLYYSLKFSHAVIDGDTARYKAALRTMGADEGLAFLLDDWLPLCAAIQQSWVGSGETVYRFEDLIERDIELLEQALLKDCRLPVAPECFGEAVFHSRFEKLTGGRLRGQEEVTAHYRKGVAGDWHNHFSDALAKRFNDRYGELLVATGYERDGRW